MKISKKISMTFLVAFVLTVVVVVILIGIASVRCAGAKSVVNFTAHVGVKEVRTKIEIGVGITALKIDEKYYASEGYKVTGRKVMELVQVDDEGANYTYWWVSVRFDLLNTKTNAKESIGRIVAVICNKSLKLNHSESRKIVHGHEWDWDVGCIHSSNPVDLLNNYKGDWVRSDIHGLDDWIKHFPLTSPELIDKDEILADLS